MVISFEISEKSFDLLKKISEAKMAEFRDNEYESFEDFKRTPEFEDGDGFRSERWFKNRNFCDIKDLSELIECNLIESDYMSWHMTYVVSPFGEKILKNNL